MSIIDYRKPEVRIEGFRKFYLTQLLSKDVDSTCLLLRPLANHYGLDLEQRLWLSWLYGATYRYSSTIIIWKQFPDHTAVDEETFNKWYDENQKKILFETDTKWNRYRMKKMFAAMKRWLGGKTFVEKMTPHLQHGDAKKNFNSWFDDISHNLTYFGRAYCVLFSQAINATTDLPLECTSLYLDRYDDGGSDLIKKGMCYAFNKEEWIGEYTPERVQYLTEQADAAFEWVKDEFKTYNMDLRYTQPANYLSFESCFCSYRKLWKGTSYIGYYTDFDHDEYELTMKNGWGDFVDWGVVLKFRKEHFDPRMLRGPYTKEKAERFKEWGVIPEMHWFLRNEPEHEVPNLLAFMS